MTKQRKYKLDKTRRNELIIKVGAITLVTLLSGTVACNGIRKKQRKEPTTTTTTTTTTETIPEPTTTTTTSTPVETTETTTTTTTEPTETTTTTTTEPTETIPVEITPEPTETIPVETQAPTATPIPTPRPTQAPAAPTATPIPTPVETIPIEPEGPYIDPYGGFWTNKQDYLEFLNELALLGMTMEEYLREVGWLSYSINNNDNINTLENMYTMEEYEHGSYIKKL